MTSRKPDSLVFVAAFHGTVQLHNTLAKSQKRVFQATECPWHTLSCMYIHREVVENTKKLQCAVLKSKCYKKLKTFGSSDYAASYGKAMTSAASSNRTVACSLHSKENVIQNEVHVTDGGYPKSVSPHTLGDFQEARTAFSCAARRFQTSGDRYIRRYICMNYPCTGRQL